MTGHGRRVAATSTTILRGVCAVVAVCAAATLTLQAQAPSPDRPWFDPDRPIAERVAALVGAMTLDEKVGQMMDQAPAIDRLGVPAYGWWNEALHGVARAGVATVFPQAIALAATFDEPLMQRVATVISDEARAKHHEFVRQGKRERYQGLTFFSPNINIFRDPRWGRGHETYGEDPVLTGRMAVAFIRGMQGDDPTYLKTITTAKHYAVHSGPEADRHSFDARVSPRDLIETYLPHFERAVREGGVLSVMTAYNAVDGVPVSANRALLDDLLRARWGFGGYVVTDCGAINDMWKRHLYSADAAVASAQAVKAGTDLECGNDFRRLTMAVQRGLITEADLDRALTRLFTARMRLGHVRSAGARGVRPHPVRRERLGGASRAQPRGRAQVARAARERRHAAARAGRQAPGRHRPDRRRRRRPRRQLQRHAVGTHHDPRRACGRRQRRGASW